jgi:Zn-dependent protease
MFRSVRVGRLFGIPLYVHPTFLLLPVWVAFTNPEAGAVGLLLLLGWVVALFGCVVLHELGHALAARSFGIGTRDITLYPIGGVARLERMSEKPVQELLIALAGPAVNLVIALLLTPVVLLSVFASHGLALNLNPDSGWALPLQFLTLLWVSNIVLLVVNLLPLFPMDGGRVLRALLSMRLGILRATEIAAKVGIALAVIVGVVVLCFFRPVNPLTIALLVFVVFAGQAELRGIRWREAQRRLGVPLAAEPVPPPRPLTLSADQPPPAELNAGFSGYTWHREFGVWVLWRQGRPVAFWRAGAE